jgi:hypothetical protein
VSDSLCGLRDGYVGRWLDAAQRQQFEAHLRDCGPCRQALAEQDYLGRLLREAVDPVPAGLVKRVESRLRRARRHRAVARCAGLAAAVGVGCLAVARFFPRGTGVPPAPHPDESAAGPSPAVLALPPVRVTFAHPADVIAVPEETRNPNVTIIWVYPAVEAPPFAARPCPESPTKGASHDG